MEGGPPLASTGPSEQAQELLSLVVPEDGRVVGADEAAGLFRGQLQIVGAKLYHFFSCPEPGQWQWRIYSC